MTTNLSNPNEDPVSHQLSDYDRETLDLLDDGHFPWSYTEIGVRCSCGEWMTDETCPVVARVRAVIDARDEAQAEAKNLFRQLSRQERFNIESRRSLCEQSDRFQAERDAAVDARDKAEARADLLNRQLADLRRHLLRPEAPPPNPLLAASVDDLCDCAGQAMCAYCTGSPAVTQ